MNKDKIAVEFKNSLLMFIYNLVFLAYLVRLS